MKGSEQRDTTVVLLLTMLLFAAILTISIAKSYPLVGRDFAYFAPRLVDTFLYNKINGLSIQWYTPSFGGGLPAYPNPQHVQFSLPQVLTTWLGPWTGYLVSTALFSLAGFLALFYFLHRVLAYKKMASILGALLFVANGFYFEHMAVGHLGYQPFPLLGLLLIAMFSQSLPILVPIGMLALIICLLINGAGFYLVAIFALSMGMIIPLLYLIKPSIFDWKRLFVVGAGGTSLGVLLSASKISAVLSFMRSFPRIIEDNYSVGLAQGLTGLILQLLGAMHLFPIAALGTGHIESIPELVNRSIGCDYGIWETDVSVSPVLVTILIIGLLRSRTGNRKVYTKDQLLMGFLLLTNIWICVEFSLAKGLIYDSVKHLPILQSLHINVRFASAFILPLVLAGSAVVDRLAREWPPRTFRVASAIAFVLTFLLLSPYVFKLPYLQRRYFDISRQEEIYQRVKEGQTFPILEIGSVEDSESLRLQSSSLDLYEPVFGYGLERFRPKVTTGSVWMASGGYFNLTDPSGFVFPEINRSRLFDRIRVEDKEKLDKFAKHYSPEWKIPVYQQMFDWLCGVGSIFVSILLGAYVIQQFWIKVLSRGQIFSTRI